MRQVGIAATTGFFDGVHTGHRYLLQQLVSRARSRGDESLVVTFWPHPRTVLQDGARELRLLTTLDEKKALLSALGVDRVEVLAFSPSFAALTARQYLAFLQERWGVTTLLMGYDNRVGSDRLRFDALSPAAAQAGVELLEAGPLGLDPPVSSTRIRNELALGNVSGAARMLGCPYTLHGVVVAGNRLGRTIGFPTANMQLYEPLKLIPARGVYAVEAEVLGEKWRGMTNIGTRPTVGGTIPTIETHLLDFDREIYGLPLRLHFLRRIRDEVCFPSLRDLQVQLAKDALNCKK